MKLDIYQVDTFTDESFRGNAACVCPLNQWLDDEIMQKIASENAVPETAFFVSKGKGFEIRWFTPDIEMDLCGHATLAAAHVIARHHNYGNSKIIFYSVSGELFVTVDEEFITLNFPSRRPVATKAPQVILDSLETEPIDILKDRDYIFVYGSEDEIRKLQPNSQIFDQINLDPGGLIITAKGKKADFVSRFFTPQASILEDPVTGSSHCSLIPYWAEKLNKKELLAFQLSPRGGVLRCELADDRVYTSGNAVTYLEGAIYF